MLPVTIQDLKINVALKELPEEHLQWILDHSEYHEYEDGSVVKRTGEEADAMIFILEGRIDFYLNVNGRFVFYYTFVNDEATGGVSGLLPYSRMKVYSGNSFAVGTLRVLLVQKEYFSELEKLNPGFIQRLVGYMTGRARTFATTQMQQEKVSALGKLSAGIAHELNNPASAISRISSELNHRLQLNYELTEKLLRDTISSGRLQDLKNIIDSKYTAQNKKLTVLQRMEREEGITQWLEHHKLAGAQLGVETFVASGFEEEDLERIRGNSNQDEFIQILRWLENLLGSQRAIKDLEEASARISNLVGAIKSHVHMDRTNELQPTDIHRDIENTLILLGYKLRDKNISVKKIFCDHLAPVPAYIGELNQVWTNIIDNAIYALERNGELLIKTACTSNTVTVNIIDNGTGIPPEIQTKIFDPFFTTKKVGEGTGIGLDLVKRIVNRHNGEVKVNSRPGRTEFILSLPAQNGKENTR